MVGGLVFLACNSSNTQILELNDILLSVRSCGLHQGSSCGVLSAFTETCVCCIFVWIGRQFIYAVYIYAFRTVRSHFVVTGKWASVRKFVGLDAQRV
jgi:hypothetical protein